MAPPPIDWDAIRRDVRANIETPASWPKDVKPISVDGLTLIGIDDRNRIYWDGRRIATALKLNWFELLLLALAAVGTLLSGITDLLEYLRINLV